ncbi:uncharacterized protein BDZ99DRAFT_519442 [Mytilinidion resinicola]|uniref:Uncharacterized protein n=1 Tax=Mytilinidion resinicola TaxID=574789 RepID=A0A6A6YQG8_9PEZI|nr:uncharacterized protein BDZ99DRAFT_519442 [Mytilinidion resinicola]KAF2810759.1 hypothetical protein BDZ99DRAFT_519442 [Mytilinidion resinicola]
MNAIVTSFLYKMYDNKDKVPWLPFTQFLRTIAQRPDLALLVKDVRVRRWMTERCKAEAEFGIARGQGTDTSFMDVLSYQDQVLFVNVAKQIGLIDAHADTGEWDMDSTEIRYSAYIAVEYYDFNKADSDAEDSNTGGLPADAGEEEVAEVQEENVDEQGDNDEDENDGGDEGDGTDEDSDSDDSASDSDAKLEADAYVVDMPSDDSDDEDGPDPTDEEAHRIRAARYLRERWADVRLRRDADWPRMLYTSVEDAELVLLLALLPKLEKLQLDGIPNTPFLCWKSFVQESSDSLKCLQTLNINVGSKGSAKALLSGCKALETFEFSRHKHYERMTLQAMDDASFQPRSVIKMLQSQRHSLKNLRIEHRYRSPGFGAGGPLFFYPSASDDAHELFMGPLVDFEKLETLWTSYEDLISPENDEEVGPALEDPCLSDVLPPSIITLNLSGVPEDSVAQVVRVADLSPES